MQELLAYSYSGQAGQIGLLNGPSWLGGAPVGARKTS